MDTIIILVAKYAVFLVALGAALVWLRARRRDQLSMVVAAALTLLLVWGAITLAGHLWTDPRPFAVDGSTPLIAHPADNGFPSDHTVLGAAIAAAVMFWRRWVGLGLMLVAVAVGAARVAAHIHHVPDVAGGLAIGIVCAVVGVLLATRSVGYVTAHRSEADVSRV